MDDEYTLEEFCELTRNDYGKEIIQQLMEQIKKRGNTGRESIPTIETADGQLQMDLEHI